jgi:predicted Co/Zn/Cd cation transporter (cation efflux family)
MSYYFMVFLCVYALYSAIDALVHGGRSISSGYALLYAVVAAIGCFAIAYKQRHAAKETASPLFEVEAKGWLIDGFLSSAVCVAFVVLVLVEKTSWSLYTPYADPLIVVVLVLLAAPIPVTVVRTSVRELLLGAPGRDFQGKVRTKLLEATRPLPLKSTILRMVKVGRTLYLHAYLIVSESHKTVTVEDLDAVRERIAAELGQLDPRISLDVTFTLDDRWAQPLETNLRILPVSGE